MPPNSYCNVAREPGSQFPSMVARAPVESVVRQPGMYENVVTLKAPNERILHVWFEPWAEGLGFPPGMVIELRASSLLEGQLEIDTTEERTAVYGWPGITLQVFVNGEIVHSFDQDVPDIVTSHSVKEMISMLFGPPPVPTAEEGATVRKKAWWRFWR